MTTTITAKQAESIMLPVCNSKTTRSLFNYISSCSLFDPYKQGDDDLYVTYSVRDNGFIKDLYISDENGVINPKSNKITFRNNFFKIN